MATRLLILTVAACAATGANAEEIYDFYLNMTYDRVDVRGGNNDGKLQCSELQAFINLMELDDVVSSNDVASICSSADTTGKGDGISRDELVEFIKTGASDAGYQQLGNDIISKLTGAPKEGAAVVSIEADPVVEAAKAIVDVEMTCNGDPEALLPSERTQIKENLIAAVAPGTPLNAVFIRFLQGSMVIKAKFFLPDADAADAAEANVQTNLGTASASSTVISAGLAVPVTVNSAPSVTKASVLGVQELEVTIPAAIAAFAAVLVVFSCCLASMAAKSKRKAASEGSAGCCSNGCCSGYAMKAWSRAVLFGCVFLGVGAGLLYVAMDNTTQGIKCILDNIIALTTLPAGSEARNAISSIEEDLALIDPVREQIDLLNIAVILPAVFAILLLALGALCACRSSSSACCAKLFMLLSNVVLLVCLIFYSLFAGLAVAMQFETVTNQLTVVTTLCETTAPTLEQTFQDLTATLARASTAPPGAISAADLAEYQQALADAQPAFEIFQSTCSCISDIFAEFVNLFVPGVISCVAIIVCFVANNYLCCAAGCCGSPKPKKGSGTKKGLDGPGGIDMPSQSV